MRICIIRNSEGPMNAQLIRIGTALNKTDNEFFFLTRNRDSDSDKKIIKKELEIQGTKVVNYEIQLPAMIGGGIKNIVPLIKYNKILYEWLDDNKEMYDAIHAIDYDVGSVALKIKKKHEKKIIYHIADFYADSRLKIPNIIKKYLRNKEYGVINNADATIICTDDRKGQIEGSNPKKLTVVHNTPPVKQKKLVIKSIDDKIKITYVGGQEKKRFIDQAISAIKNMPNYHLTLAGSVGDARESIKEISSIKNIEFLGKVSYERALQLYEDTDIMFAIYDPEHPNHKYSAANKVYEAMLLGRPIVVANNTGMDKIVRDEDMGYTIDFNQESFEKLLEHLSNNKEELYKKSKNSYQAYSKYSWEKMQQRIINLYHDIEKE